MEHPEKFTDDEEQGEASKTNPPPSKQQVPNEDHQNQENPSPMVNEETFESPKSDVTQFKTCYEDTRAQKYNASGKY